MVGSSVAGVCVALTLAAVGTLVPAGAGSAPDPDLLPPTLLAPAAGATIQPGSDIVFRVRTHAGDKELWLHVSKSQARDHYGVIDDDVWVDRFHRTGTPGVYEVLWKGEHWPVVGGRFYWQANRSIAETHTLPDFYVESSIRALRLEPTPLAEGRLTGAYDIREKITAAKNLDLRVGNVDEDTYTFKPLCAAGACDTTMSFTFARQLKIKLTRSGSSYTGSAPASISVCAAGFHPKGTLDVRLQVTEVDRRGDAVVARRFVGSFRYSTPELSTSIARCPAAWMKASFDGIG